ncbi:unnamed protein product, partial [marine sediment metagenome]
QNKKTGLGKIRYEKKRISAKDKVYLLFAGKI